MDPKTGLWEMEMILNKPKHRLWRGASMAKESIYPRLWNARAKYNAYTPEELLWFSISSLLPSSCRNFAWHMTDCNLFYQYSVTIMYNAALHLPTRFTYILKHSCPSTLYTTSCKIKSTNNVVKINHIGVHSLILFLSSFTNTSYTVTYKTVNYNVHYK